MEMKKIEFFGNWPSPAKTRVLFIVSLILVIFFNDIFGVVGMQFRQVEYPVPLPLAWFSFSGPELKSHYALLLDQGTMDAYLRLQYLDYGYMVSTGLLFFTLAVIVARKHKVGSFWRRFGFVGALIIPASASMDAIENVFLLVMLSSPLEFPDWLAIPYSSFASAKLALFILGILWLILIAIALVVSRLATRYSK
jgi:hypothetical protein